MCVKFSSLLTYTPRLCYHKKQKAAASRRCFFGFSTFTICHQNSCAPADPCAHAALCILHF